MIVEFNIGRDKLRYIAATMVELEDVVASPTHGTIVAHDTMSTRRFACTVPTGEGKDVGIDPSSVLKVSRRVRGEASVSIGPEKITIKSGHTTYKLRAQVPPRYMVEPDTSGVGKVALPAAEMVTMLGDVRAAGVGVVVIMIDDGKAVFRGDGATDCRITAEGAEVSGKGYSRLDLDLLLPCVPALKECQATISLAPKGPTMMMFGDDMVYHQAQRL